jgi:hypothetical protein
MLNTLDLRNHLPSKQADEGSGGVHQVKMTAEDLAACCCGLWFAHRPRDQTRSVNQLHQSSASIGPEPDRAGILGKRGNGYGFRSPAEMRRC